MQRASKKLSIIIPCYNEDRTLETLINNVRSVNLVGISKEIIIVDDGSKQSTLDILKELESQKDLKIVYHKVNRGKGFAIRTGLKHATGDYVIIQDADLEYDPNDYQQILEELVKPEKKVVYGSRRLKADNSQYSAISYFFGGVILTLLTNLLYRTHITDEPTCYKAFETDIIKSIPLNCERFEFCPEVTAKVAKRGITIHEVPIHYYPRSIEEGKHIRWKDGVDAIWTLVKYRFVD